MAEDCVCAIRGYCADAPGDPLACPVCVSLGPDDECPARLLTDARRGGEPWVRDNDDER